jgi:hypothetical protein
MLDPISLLATATAVFNGLKKAVELGREAEDVFGQLGKWAGAVSDLQEWMSGQENTKPPLFKKLVFSKSATVEAFDAYAAQVKIKEMEKTLYHWFHYGALQHLGRDGYVEFIQMRRRIKEQREKMVYEQIRRRKKFIKNTSDAIFISVVVGMGSIIMFHIVKFMVDRWPE